MGHCDIIEGKSAEWATIHALEEEGYLLVGFSHRATHIVLRDALQKRPRLRTWVSQWKCQYCQARRQYPYVSTHTGTVCQDCLYGSAPRRQ